MWSIRRFRHAQKQDNNFWESFAPYSFSKNRLSYSALHSAIALVETAVKSLRKGRLATCDTAHTTVHG